MSIREYLKKHKILADGAMGTYFEMLHSGQVSEYANLENPREVEKIHLAYIKAGANLIMTNTFAANEHSMGLSSKKVDECVRKGIEIARSAIDKSGQQNLFLAGDIGRIVENGENSSEALQKRYQRNIDIFLEEKVPVIVFETFLDLEPIRPLVKYIREKNTEVFIIVSLCVNKNGYTTSGMSGRRLLEELVEMEEVDACGLNCGIGSGHMLQLAQDLQDLFQQKYFLIMPNAGYPEQMRNRMVFLDNRKYFADNMQEIADLNVAIVGGCCGTTPDYIFQLEKRIDLSPVVIEKRKTVTETSEVFKHPQKKNLFYEKLKSNKKVIAVELDPPYDANYEKLIECALHLKQCDVDMITMADSPMGRSRADSILMSIKLANETEMPVMPHLSCRDRNMIAMRSSILGAYIHKIRNMLLVTGDPVPSVSRGDTTGVFDYHSIRLMQFMKEMNEEHFVEDPIEYGGALNYGRGKIENVAKRMQQKIDAGCSYFLTQPIYSKEDIARIRQLKEMVDTKILCGIMPLVSYRNANFIKNEMTGINVPDEIVERYSMDMSKEEAEIVGAQIASEIIEQLSDFADGYYFMLPFNRVSLMDKIIIR